MTQSQQAIEILLTARDNASAAVKQLGQTIRSETQQIQALQREIREAEKGGDAPQAAYLRNTQLEQRQAAREEAQYERERVQTRQAIDERMFRLTATAQQQELAAVDAHYRALAQRWSANEEMLTKIRQSHAVERSRVMARYVGQEQVAERQGTREEAQYQRERVQTRQAIEDRIFRLTATAQQQELAAVDAHYRALAQRWSANEEMLTKIRSAHAIERAQISERYAEQGSGAPPVPPPEGGEPGGGDGMGGGYYRRIGGALGRATAGRLGSAIPGAGAAMGGYQQVAAAGGGAALGVATAGIALGVTAFVASIRATDEAARKLASALDEASISGRAFREALRGPEITTPGGARKRGLSDEENKKANELEAKLSRMGMGIEGAFYYTDADREVVAAQAKTARDMAIKHGDEADKEVRQAQARRDQEHAWTMDKIRLSNMEAGLPREADELNLRHRQLRTRAEWQIQDEGLNPESTDRNVVRRIAQIRQEADAQSLGEMATWHRSRNQQETEARLAAAKQAIDDAVGRMIEDDAKFVSDWAGGQRADARDQAKWSGLQQRLEAMNAQATMSGRDLQEWRIKREMQQLRDEAAGNPTAMAEVDRIEKLRIDALAGEAAGGRAARYTSPGAVERRFGASVAAFSGTLADPATVAAERAAKAGELTAAGVERVAKAAEKTAAAAERTADGIADLAVLEDL